MTTARMKELLKNAINMLESTNTCGKSLMGTDLEDDLNITQEEYDAIKSIDKLHTVIYVVAFEWNTEDESDLDIFTFAEFKDALKKYNDIISDEMNPKLSWVGKDALDEQGHIKNRDYTLNCKEYTNKEEDLHWYVADYYSEKHSCVNLYIKQI